jgi:hypothetical protein
MTTGRGTDVQLTVRSPSVPEEEVVLTLRLDQSNGPTCGICEQRLPDWQDDPASATAMNPIAGPLGAPAICSVCLNFLIEVGTLEIIQVDPRSF